MLTTSRQIGFGAVGPLAYCDMLLYLDENGISDKDERDDMLYAAMKMSVEVRNYIATNATSWKKLKINESDLDEFAFNLQGPKAKRDLSTLRNTSDYELAVIVSIP